MLPGQVAVEKAPDRKEGIRIKVVCSHLMVNNTSDWKVLTSRRSFHLPLLINLSTFPIRQYEGASPPSRLLTERAFSTIPVDVSEAWEGARES